MAPGQRGLGTGGFFWRAGVAAATFWLLVAAWNVVVDAHGTFGLYQEIGFNQRKAGNTRLTQALRFLDERPTALLLATSRGYAFATTLDDLPQAPRTQVYAVPDLRAAEAAELLRFFGRETQLELLYLGLDFFSLNAAGVRAPPLYARLDGLFWVDFVLRHMLSWDAAREGLRVIERSGRPAEIKRALTGSGEVQPAPTLEETRRLFRSVIGQFQRRRYYQDFVFDAEGLARLEAALVDRAAAGAEIVIFIGPPHVTLLGSIRAVGAWPQYEIYLRELAALGRRHGWPVWDFALVDATSTEPIAGVMQGYRDPSHFRPAVAARIMARLRGGGDAGYGVRLDQVDVAAHVAAKGAALEAYLVANPDVVALLREAAAREAIVLRDPLFAPPSAD